MPEADEKLDPQPSKSTEVLGITSSTPAHPSAEDGTRAIAQTPSPYRQAPPEIRETVAETVIKKTRHDVTVAAKRNRGNAPAPTCLRQEAIRLPTQES